MYTKPILDASAPILAARNRLATLAKDLPRYREHVSAAEAELARRQQRGATHGEIQAARQHLEHARRRVAGTEALIAEVQAGLPALDARHKEVWAEERERRDAAAEASKAEAVRQREVREAERRRWIDIHASEASRKRRFAR